MGVLAHFKITDYQGQLHEYYHFGDGHPLEKNGVISNFPRGDRDFCLDTFVRKLDLEKRERNYFVDVYYILDLRSRTIEVSSPCFKDIEFKGTFEEAIRFFEDADYSEKDALDEFPKKEDLMPILNVGFLDGFWKIIKAVTAAVPHLKYDFHCPKLVIGDGTIFYKYNDFIDFPRFEMNGNLDAIEDAYANVRRIGMILYLTNTITNQKISVYYMLRVYRDGFWLPLTEKFIRYGETLDEETKQMELAMMVKMISLRDPSTLKAQNFLYGILSDKMLKEIKDLLKNE